MPYAELDLIQGSYKLLMDTKLIYRLGVLYQISPTMVLGATDPVENKTRKVWET